MFLIPYRWMPAAFIPNIRSAFADVVWGVKNIIRWTPVIWFDADFDWAYLARVMEFKLRLMSEHFTKYGHLVGSDRDAKQTLVCAELLKRLTNDFHYQNAKIRLDVRAASIHAEKAAKNDQRYLGRLIGKYLRNWWD